MAEPTNTGIAVSCIVCTGIARTEVHMGGHPCPPDCKERKFCPRMTKLFLCVRARMAILFSLLLF